MITIRPATLEDLSTVILLDATDEFEKPIVSLNEVKLHLAYKIQSGDAFLALLNEQIVGYARVDMLWPSMYPMLSWIYVEPFIRRMGIASRLRDFIFVDLKRRGFTSLLRSANTARPHVIQALRDSGLIECGNLKFYKGDSEIFFWQPL